MALISLLSRPHVSRVAGRALAIVLSGSVLRFGIGFFGSDQDKGNAFDVAAWILFLVIILGGTVTVARITPSAWG
jgi:hypothetical protein